MIVGLLGLATIHQKILIIRENILGNHNILTNLEKIKLLFEQIRGYELIGSRQHPADFNLVRAEYINTRVRFLALLFSVLTPLWIPVDFFILQKEDFVPVMVAR